LESGEVLAGPEERQRQRETLQEDSSSLVTDAEESPGSDQQVDWDERPPPDLESLDWDFGGTLTGDEEVWPRPHSASQSASQGPRPIAAKPVGTARRTGRSLVERRTPLRGDAGNARLRSFTEDIPIVVIGSRGNVEVKRPRRKGWRLVGVVGLLVLTTAPLTYWSGVSLKSLQPEGAPVRAAGVVQPDPALPAVPGAILPPTGEGQPARSGTAVTGQTETGKFVL
jgi:hypothetical protein